MAAAAVPDAEILKGDEAVLIEAEELKDMVSGKVQDKNGAGSEGWVMVNKPNDGQVESEEKVDCKEDAEEKEATESASDSETVSDTEEFQVAAEGEGDVIPLSNEAVVLEEGIEKLDIIYTKSKAGYGAETAGAAGYGQSTAREKEKQREKEEKLQHGFRTGSDTLSNFREDVYRVCIYAKSQFSTRQRTKIGFIWGKGFCLNSKFITLNMIRFVSKQHHLERPLLFATLIVLSYVDHETEDFKHVFLEMNTIKEVHDLFGDFQTLMRAKFDTSSGDNVKKAAYEVVYKQPIHYSVGTVWIIDRSGAISICSCALILDMECLAVYPQQNEGERVEPYLLKFSLEDSDMSIDKIVNRKDAGTVALETRKYKFIVKTNADFLMELRECKPVCLADPAAVQQYVSSEYLIEKTPVCMPASKPKDTVMSRFLRELDCAIEQCKDDPDFRLRWQAVDTVLNDLEQKGKIQLPLTQTQLMRGCIDRYKPEHVRAMLGDVVEHLNQFRVDEALSLLKAVRMLLNDQTSYGVVKLLEHTDFEILQKLFYWNIVFGLSQNTSTGQMDMSEWNKKKLTKDISSRLEDALARCAEKEDIQVYWVSVEADLNDIIASGNMIYLGSCGAGYSEDNPLHLQSVLDDIAQCLKEEKYQDTLSKYNAACELFGKSKVPEIVSFIQQDQMKILKMLYCVSVITEGDLLEPAWQDDNKAPGSASGMSSTSQPIPTQNLSEPAWLGDNNAERSSQNTSWMRPPTWPVPAPVPKEPSPDIEEQRRAEAEIILDSLDEALSEASLNEDMQMYWIALEADLNEIIQSGLVPHSDANSGGLDPDNTEHLTRVLNDISDHLKSERLSFALSRLQAARQLFSESWVAMIRQVFETDDLTLLKKLYFKTLME